MELAAVEIRKIPGFCVDSDSFNHITLKYVINRVAGDLQTWLHGIF